MAREARETRGPLDATAPRVSPLRGAIFALRRIIHKTSWTRVPSVDDHVETGLSAQVETG